MASDKRKNNFSFLNIPIFPYEDFPRLENARFEKKFIYKLLYILFFSISQQRLFTVVFIQGEKF